MNNLKNNILSDDGDVCVVDISTKTYPSFTLRIDKHFLVALCSRTDKNVHLRAANSSRGLRPEVRINGKLKHIKDLIKEGYCGEQLNDDPFDLTKENLRFVEGVRERRTFNNILKDDGRVLEVDISSSQSPNQTMLIDKSDYERILITAGRIYACKSGGHDGIYARCRTKDGKVRLVHSLILNPKGVVDHINHNSLDNRRCNLRDVKPRANSMNCKPSKNNTSGRMGVWVCKNRPVNPFAACITVNRKTIHLGRYATFEEACAAREAAEVKYGFHKNHGKDI